MTLEAQIEALLFASARSISLKKISELTQQDTEKVQSAVEQLIEKYRSEERGIRLIRQAQSVQMATSAEASDIVTALVKDDQRAELTKPALETLTIIAYRGPITKAELDTIRGVNCSLILRNLMIKGLVETAERGQKIMTSYQVTNDFLSFLGLENIDQLPDYATLHSEEHMNKLLENDAKAATEAEKTAEEGEDKPQEQSEEPTQAIEDETSSSEHASSDGNDEASEGEHDQNTN
ncbi:MAG: SMC-Scp complex subunit ScpB [Candidatus Nomurabacteria bacterium]|nr:MAG: SMC-Scp complex subunit ScpB [Candidatus Nomurabacteria bacterium]